MAKTLLDGVNDALKRMGVIKGNSGSLVSLNDTQRQVVIDLAVAMWNEVIIDLYDSSEKPLPNEITAGTITLIAGQRHYDLPSNFLKIRWPMFNLTYNSKIYEYPGHWEKLFEDEIIAEIEDGLPLYAVVRPIDSKLYLDRTPRTEDAGRVYTFYYDKETLMSAATDLMPFNDTVYTLLIPAVVEKLKQARDDQNLTNFRVSMAKYDMAMGHAARMLTTERQKGSYLYVPSVCPTQGGDTIPGDTGGGTGIGPEVVTVAGVIVTVGGETVTVTV